MEVACDFLYPTSVACDFLSPTSVACDFLSPTSVACLIGYLQPYCLRHLLGDLSHCMMGYSHVSVVTKVRIEFTHIPGPWYVVMGGGGCVLLWDRGTPITLSLRVT